jgi:hypothetical protein
MKRLILILCIAFTCSLAGLCPPIDNTQKETFIFEAKKYLFYKDVFNKPFTPELLKQALFFEKIKSPEIVFIQAQIETGYFTSELFLKANNLFGMRYPRVRDTFASGEYEYHAEYRSWLSCVLDYALWQKHYSDKGYDLESYLLFLEDIGYATNKKYISLIKEMS